MIFQPASDVLSLTLPRASRSRARRRKRKPPPFWFYWWLALTVWSVYEAAHLLARGDIAWGVLNATVAALDWKIALREWRRQSYLDLMSLLVGTLVAMFVLIAVGSPS